jgi:hypothetical protein
MENVETDIFRLMRAALWNCVACLIGFVFAVWDHDKGAGEIFGVIAAANAFGWFILRDEAKASESRD